MRFNNLLVFLLLGAGTVGARDALYGHRARIVVHLPQPGVDVSVGDQTIRHASTTETFDLPAGEYELRITRGTRPLYHQRLILGTDDERDVKAWWL